MSTTSKKKPMRRDAVVRQIVEHGTIRMGGEEPFMAAVGRAIDDEVATAGKGTFEVELPTNLRGEDPVVYRIEVTCNAND
jgi:hypothetical protein